MKKLDDAIVTGPICFQSVKRECELVIGPEFFQDQVINNLMPERQFGMSHSHLVEGLNDTVAEELICVLQIPE